MSQAPQQKNDWLRNNYEKFLLLGALVFLFVSCILLIRQMDEQNDDLKAKAEQLKNQGDEVELRDTTEFEESFDNARKTAVETVEPKDRLFRSQDRVWCVKCGKPIGYEAAECPWCLGKQPEIVNVDTLDTDGDGIPDKIEQEWGLNPLDPSDVKGDLDGDGFTNIEEFLAQTDPRDNTSMPDPIVKLRIAVIKERPFYLRFKGVSIDNKGQRFQLNIRGADRTVFARKGDIVEGYQIIGYDADKPPKLGTLTLVRVKDKHQRPIHLVRDKLVEEKEWFAGFYFLIEHKKVALCGLNDMFELRGKTYKVIDIKGDSVVIQEESTGKKIQVPMLTDEDRNPSRPAPPPAAPSADPWGQP